MKVGFFASEKPRERLLADAFIRGLAAHGDSGKVVHLTGEPIVAKGCEVVVMVGVKSRELYQANIKAGIHVVMMDKGYVRHKIGGPVRIWEYWRTAVDGHHPTRTLMNVPRSIRRASSLGLNLAPWRRRGKHVLIAGSSAKYHHFYGLPDPTEYTLGVVKKIRQHTDMEIVYRPKPSWRGAQPIHGTTFSGPGDRLDDVLDGCHVLVTHGSNACFEAMLSGVPSVILGDGITLPISTDKVRAVNKPFLAPMADRRQWLANLAYCQWTMHEFESGEAWATIRPQIYG